MEEELKQVQEINKRKEIERRRTEQIPRYIDKIKKKKLLYIYMHIYYMLYYKIIHLIYI